MNNYNIVRNDNLANTLNKVSYVVSAIVLILVGVMRRYKIDLGIDFSFLPPIHAILNTVAFFALCGAWYFVKRKNIDLHRKFVFVAMLCSFLFLLCYVLYHFTTLETKYCGEGTMRTCYFILLISHIVLAGISLPFILLTFIRGFTGQIDKHKPMARWVYPIWLYVAFTGPICYFMLYPCYK